MKKSEFIPYEQALALKELGFNEECIKYYDYGGKMYEALEKNKLFIETEDECCYAPLWQQVFRWFREKYDFRYSIGETNICVYHIPVTNYHTTFMIQDCKSYEEAELQCIKAFIEIAKNKN